MKFLFCGSRSVFAQNFMPNIKKQRKKAIFQIKILHEMCVYQLRPGGMLREVEKRKLRSTPSQFFISILEALNPLVIPFQ